MGNSSVKPKEGEVLYEISVVTGSRKHAGTDANVFITLHGTNGGTGEIQLDHKLHDDFEAGKTDKFSIAVPDLGELYLVDIWLIIGKKTDYWFLNTITIVNKSTKQSWNFPAYRWILDKEEIFEGTATLPQNDKIVRKLQERKDETEKKRGIYQWRRTPGLPSCIKSSFAKLPYDERWNEEKLEDMLSARSRIAANIGIDKFFNIFSNNWKHFDDFKDFFTVVDCPPIHKDWTLDDTFGRQRLQGLNPTAIQRLPRFPITNFPVTTEMVRPLLRPGTTLSTEFQQNRLYIVDYSYFGPYCYPKYWKEGRCSFAPRCLLYLNEKNRLVPIAIQINDTPDPKLNPIFTPFHPEADWLFAKITVANAESWHHQLALHLLAVHFATEPIAVALHRQLPSCHPIYKLLIPHFKFQLAINCRAREVMINRGGPVDEISPWTYEGLVAIMSENFKKWRFDKMAIPIMLKERGTEDPKMLPNYYYRDDAVKVWNSLESFVGEIIKQYYKSDIDVVNDSELQEWINDIYTNGYNGDEHGFPKSLETINSLIQLLTTYIFSVSAQHAALNFGQFEGLAYIPAAPGHLNTVPPGFNGVPWKMGQLKMEDIFRAMPTKDQAAKQIALSFILSQFSQEDYMLGEYPETLFTEKGFKESVGKFKEKLDEISKEIEARGHFRHLNPKRVPNSTAI